MQNDCLDENESDACVYCPEPLKIATWKLLQFHNKIAKMIQ